MIFSFLEGGYTTIVQIEHFKTLILLYDATRFLISL